MSDNKHTLDIGDQLLEAWLSLSSTLWNTRIVSSMTYNEAHVLGILLRHGDDEEPLTATDLIQRTRLLKSQMNKILTTLENRDHITRIRSQADKRLIHIHLTQAGKAAYLKAHKGAETILEELIEKIGPDRATLITNEINALTKVLDSIVPMPK